MATTPPINRAEQFRQRSRIALTLPSGIEIIARKADFMRLMQLGTLPDSLSSIVSNAIAQHAQRVGKAPTGTKDGDLGRQMTATLLADPKGMFAMQDAMLKACGVEPRFVDVVSDPETEVAVEDVEPEDKQFLMQWAQGGTADVAAFRAEQQRNVPDRSEGAAVRDTPGDVAAD